jgi:hypothetical protein
MQLCDKIEETRVDLQNEIAGLWKEHRDALAEVRTCWAVPSPAWSLVRYCQLPMLCRIVHCAAEGISRLCWLLEKLQMSVVWPTVFAGEH